MYYGDRQLTYPSDGFGIWFINGVIEHHRSIRLGLSDYMGSVQKARKYLHNSGNKHLFSGLGGLDWAGSKTWVDIIFNKPICIFGLGLEENEVFLRWLLIERAKYFRKFPDKKKAGWYIQKREKIQTIAPSEKDIFLKALVSK